MQVQQNCMHANLELGAPLLTVLTAEQCAALLVHELAHSKQRDLLRSTLIGSTLYTLAIWERFCSLRVEFPFNVLFFAVTLLIKATSLFIRMLISFDAQFAEYQADALAAQIAGKKAILELLEIALLADLNEEIFFRSVRGDTVSRQIFAIFQQRIASLPPQTMARVVQNAYDAADIVGQTHPTPYRRRQALLSLPDAAARHILSDDDERAFAGDLDAIATYFHGRVVRRDRHHG